MRQPANGCVIAKFSLSEAVGRHRVFMKGSAIGWQRRRDSRDSRSWRLGNPCSSSCNPQRAYAVSQLAISQGPGATSASLLSSP